MAWMWTGGELSHEYHREEDPELFLCSSIYPLYHFIFHLSEWSASTALRNTTVLHTLLDSVVMTVLCVCGSLWSSQHNYLWQSLSCFIFKNNPPLPSSFHFIFSLSLSPLPSPSLSPSSFVLLPLASLLPFSFVSLWGPRLVCCKLC